MIKEEATRLVTIKDIAELAGVSTATVGRVMGNYGSFSDRTRKKVMDAAEQLNYIPNAIAKGMRNQSIKTIAVLIGSIKNNFFSEITYSIEKEAMSKGYNVLICNTHEDVGQEMKQLRNMYSKRIDGIIIAPAYTKDQKIRKEHLGLYKGEIPTVFIDREVNGIGGDLNLIRSNNIDGAYACTKYLIGLGHKQIAVIGTKRYSTVFERIQGYEKALLESNIPFNPKLIAYCSCLEKEEIMSTTKKLLDTQKEVTAVLVLNNSLIARVLMEVQKRNMLFPEDLSVIAWDDDDINELLGITSVKQSVDTMGTLAARRLFQMIEDPETREKSERIALETEFIIRNSCGVPRT
ncbi:MAG: LacI family DNA-binding transcriptional regulator [Eubacteriales bacterium]|nr:LacI family DNA-binding transcriptional regulator [Eubacteriales bacterium]